MNDETVYTSIKLPCDDIEEAYDQIKKAQTASMKNNLDEHIEKKKQ